MKHKNIWPPLYGVVLVLFTVYVLLDAFVIPRSYQVVTQTATGTTVQSATMQNETVENNQTTAAASTAAADAAAASDSSDAAGETTTAAGETTAAAAEDTTPVVTDTSYSDSNMTVQITQYREDDTNIYVADITLSSLDALKTAFADNTYGKNITETTSTIAAASNAILAINGDFYGTRSGYVIRNGVLYREDSAGSDQQDLVIYQDGTFGLVYEGDVTAQELLDQGAWQVLSFGPGLLENGEITVDTDTEVDKAMTSNPRTAIGVISPLHYVFVVADGRSSESTGLSLYQLSEFMQGLGVDTAYNLDGGGSSTMVFNNTVVNNPTTNGKSVKEREVSDIVYIG